MLNCKQMAELATEYLEGQLGLRQRLGYYLHALLCPPCRNFRDQVEKTARAARLAQDREDAAAEPPEVPAELLGKLGDLER
jgi:hypothetical protein